VLLKTGEGGSGGTATSEQLVTKDPGGTIGSGIGGMKREMVAVFGTN